MVVPLPACKKPPSQVEKIRPEASQLSSSIRWRYGKSDTRHPSASGGFGPETNRTDQFLLIANSLIYYLADHNRTGLTVADQVRDQRDQRA